ncbi:MAG: peroxiredoxin [Myxococcales bacterium]|nr:peroxiredoxin [Myxococcales bacterium]MCB9549408.1 peroxiredoxin [Myxococcales bacterium]
MIQPGEIAPDFTLSSDAHGDVTLSALRGKPVVLYFYPKDDTPACTQEACDFTASMGRLQALGATVLAVSPDSLRRHANFRRKHGLGIPLLSDPEKQVHELYGTWAEKTLYGRTYMGTLRTTFVIDAAGVVQHVFEKVKVKGHVDAVIEALASLPAPA